MANKKEKEKQMQDKLQIILAELLKDDDNKYCVDCDSKGPRWASWTLGIFLCIRCAGIHRNLGVHLSRVKSVNLDSWTPQQVAMMKEIGNSRGRAIYEANLDDNFRRPQTDSALEQFVRAKYEHKRYIAKEWIAPTPTVDSIAEEIRKLEQSQNKKRVNYNANTTIAAANMPIARRDNADKAAREIEKPANTCNKIDLLGLDCDPVSNNVVDDAFGDFIFAAQPFDKSTPNQTTSNGLDVTSVVVSSAVDDLMGLNLGNGEIVSNIPGINMSPPSLSMSTPSFTNSGGKLDKSSILALYNSSNSSGNAMGPQMANVQGGGWPHPHGAGQSAYQQTSGAMQSDFHSQMLYSGGSNWQISGQGNNVTSAAFGVQHNPFFNNSIFPGQSAIPISQPTSFPAASVPGGGHAQPPNQMLW